MTVYGHRPPPDEQPEPMGSQDDGFLERLFATMCRHICALPDETFVDQARRWADTFRYMAALNPRPKREWLLASDVAMQQVFAQHSLAMGRAKGVPLKRRLAYGRDFIAHARTLHEAHLRYDLLRARPADL